MIHTSVPRLPFISCGSLPILFNFVNPLLPEVKGSLSFFFWSFFSVCPYSDFFSRDGAQPPSPHPTYFESPRMHFFSSFPCLCFFSPQEVPL